MDNKNTVLCGDLGNYEWITTEDGSHTLHSHYFQESCHSTAGAYAETMYNYIEGCRIKDKIKAGKPLTIFEVGFATGLGLLCTLKTWQNSLNPSPINFMSCELDQKLTEQSLKRLGFTYKVYEDIHQANGSLITIRGKCHKDFTFIIVIGDIRQELPKIVEVGEVSNVDAIYQDPFSPKKNPSLWTFEWFKQLADISHGETVMSTYSTTKAAWKAMHHAGWGVQVTKGFGRKKTATRAYFNADTEQNVLNLMDRSPTPMFEDHNISGEKP